MADAAALFYNFLQLSPVFFFWYNDERVRANLTGQRTDNMSDLCRVKFALFLHNGCIHMNWPTSQPCCTAFFLIWLQKWSFLLNTCYFATLRSSCQVYFPQRTKKRQRRTLRTFLGSPRRAFFFTRPYFLSYVLRVIQEASCMVFV